MKAHQNGICNARKRDGSRCQKPPVTGRNRCRLHGGATPIAGPTHPSWKNGKRSKLRLSAGLRKHIERVESHPDLMTLREEIIILDALISEAITGLGDHPATPDQRSNLAALFETKGRLLLQELKRQREIGSLYTVERVFGIVEAVFAAIKEVVGDGDKIAEIGRRFSKIAGGRYHSAEETSEDDDARDAECN